MHLKICCYLLLPFATYYYLLLPTVTYSYLPLLFATDCYLFLPTVTSSYLQLPIVTYCYLFLPTITYCYLLLPIATYCYLLVPTVTCCHLLLPTATYSYLLFYNNLAATCGDRLLFADNCLYCFSVCSDCGLGLYTSSACTATHDTVCSPCTECTAMEYAATDCLLGVDTVCNSCEQCIFTDNNVQSKCYSDRYRWWALENCCLDSAGNTVSRPTVAYSYANACDTLVSCYMPMLVKCSSQLITVGLHAHQRVTNEVISHNIINLLLFS